MAKEFVYSSRRNKVSKPVRDQNSNEKNWFLRSHQLMWRGTHGPGDMLLALNVAHYVATSSHTPIELVVYWNYDEGVEWHYDDVEFIEEKLRYWHRLYHNNQLVTIRTVYDHNVDFFNGRLHHNLCDQASGEQEFSGKWKILDGVNNFGASQHLLETPVEEKLCVMWSMRDINKDYSPLAKTDYDDMYFYYMESILRAKGWTVYEINHRTPAAEAAQMMQRCRFCIGYTGMYIYLSKLFFKPTIIVGDGPMTKVGASHAKRFTRPRNDGRRAIIDFIYNIEENIIELDNKVKKYRNRYSPYFYEKGRQNY
jgi:hypothetical protein